MKFKLIVMSVLLGALIYGISAVQAQMNNSSKPSTAQGSGAMARNQPLKASAENADFIFRGVVTRIEYRMSANEPQLPHSFVTFKVEKRLKGQFNQQFVTLRFIGGPTGNGNFLTVSEVPLFDVGERSILLVQGNGQSGCPLVGCADGRFRIISDQVFTDEGQPIALNNQGELTYGRPLPLAEVINNRIGDISIRDVLSNEESLQDAAGGRVVRSQQELVASSSSLSASQLEHLIQNQVQQLGSSTQMQARQFNVSVDSQASFSVAQPRPVSPPAIAVPHSESSRPSSLSETERRELEMLWQNGGNPVFPNSKP
jgi:hypothetical protein